MDFDLTGTVQGLANLESIARQLIPTIARSFSESGEQTMTKSKDVYCPVDTGVLRASGTTQIETSETKVTLVWGYGGAASSYAVAVHETNKNYRGGKQWKYLETPIKEDIGDIEQKTIEDIRGIRP